MLTTATTTTTAATSNFSHIVPDLQNGLCVHYVGFKIPQTQRPFQLNAKNKMPTMDAQNKLLRVFLFCLLCFCVRVRASVVSFSHFEWRFFDMKCDIFGQSLL